MARSNEPFFWALFSAGGVISAFFMPATVLLLTGWFASGRMADHATATAFVNHPITRVYLTVFIALCLFHFAHRFRYVLHDFGLHAAATLQAWLFYGAAFAGTALAVFLLFFA